MLRTKQLVPLMKKEFIIKEYLVYRRSSAVRELLFLVIPVSMVWTAKVDFEAQNYFLKPSHVFGPNDLAQIGKNLDTFLMLL